MKDLEKLKEIFLNVDDEETLEHNRQQIAEWEQSIQQNSAYADWQNHDITRMVSKQARETYINAAVQLSKNRSLSTAEREALWAKQDAMLFLLTIFEKDAKGELEYIEREIKKELDATN